MDALGRQSAMWCLVLAMVELAEKCLSLKFWLNASIMGCRF